MKRLLVLIGVSVLLFTSCQGSQNISPSTELTYEQSVSESTNKELLENYYAIVDEEPPYKAYQFLIDNIQSASTLEADIMIVALIDLQNKYLSDYQTKALDAKYQDSLALIAKQRKFETSSFKVDSFMYELQKGSFRIVEGSEGYIPVPDYSQMKFDGFTSTSLSDYLDILSVEASKVYMKDNQLNITWEELAKRTYQCEAFLKKHSKSMKEKEVMEMYMAYINGLTKKVGETFIYEDQSFNLLDDVRQVYLNYIYLYPGYETTNILDWYLKNIEQKGTITNELLDQVERLIEESVLLSKYSK